MDDVGPRRRRHSAKCSRSPGRERTGRPANGREADNGNARRNEDDDLDDQEDRERRDEHEGREDHDVPDATEGSEVDDVGEENDGRGHETRVQKCPA